MTDTADLIQLRLANQQISRAKPVTPEDVVRQLGLIQAQDYLGSLWAIGLRASSDSESTVEQALNERRIVRTWPARGTLHYVLPQDVRWILNLLAPRAIAASKLRNRQLALDDEAFAKSRVVFTKALQDGKQLTREELYAALEAGGISTDGQRGYHILWRMGQEGLVCFGPRRGKQQTFVLLDEWIPPPKSLDRNDALREITLRYFAGHGPATLKDFSWWSGLSATDAKKGIEIAQDQLTQVKTEDQVYWLTQRLLDHVSNAVSTVLLPPFDEYTVGYADRGLVLEPQFAKFLNAGGGILHPVIVFDGIVVGTWKRNLKKKTVLVSADWFQPPTHAQVNRFEQAAQKYAAFLDLPAVIS